MSTEITRTPMLIASEINAIKQQTYDVLNGALTFAKRSCFEIGKRLEEAKALLPRGEWGAWLSENFEYSETTARDLMRIYREYGNEQIDLLSGKSDAEIFEGLSQSRLVELFALPKPMRAEFVEAHREELESGEMSVREMREEIRRLNAELEEKTDELREEGVLYNKLQEEWREAERENERLREIEDTAKELNEENEALQKALKDMQDAPKEVQEVSVTVHEPSAEQIEKIRREALAEAEEKHKNDIEKLSSDLEEREKKHKEILAEAEAAANRKLKEARLASDPHASRVSYAMEAIGRAMGEIDGEIRAMEAESAGSGIKMRMQCESALLRLLNKFGWQV